MSDNEQPSRLGKTISGSRTLNADEIRENMQAKEIPILKDALGRDELVTIVILTREPETMLWRDQWFDMTKPPREFIPKITSDGVIQCRIPLPYAQRLLAGEPYKFFLQDPDFIRIKVPTVGGGEVVKKVYAHVPKKDGNGNIVRDKVAGHPVMVINPKVAEAVEKGK